MVRIASLFIGLCLTTNVALAERPPLGLEVKKVGANLVLQHPTIEGLSQFVEHSSKPPAPPLVQPLPAPQWDADGEVVAATRVTEQLKPGTFVVRKFDPQYMSFSTVLEEPAGELSEAAWAAVDLAPDWLKVELTGKFARLPTQFQNDYAALMIEAEDPRFLDELAFLIANTTAGDLTHEYIRPRYLSDQVKFLYAADALLGYVSIKEVGTPGEGDYWTTTVYKYTEEGVEKEYELPRDHYYWWIVHPRLDGEELYDIRPDTGKFAGYPLALTYKEFFLFNPETTENYMDHYVFRDPPPYEAAEKGLKLIPLGDLQDCGPSQRGAFVDLKIGPNHLTRDSQGRTTSMEFRIRHKGIILATTMLLEKAWAEDKCEALQTFLRHGPGNVPAQAKHKHLVVMETAPFGLDGVIEEVLDEFDVNYEIISAAELLDYDLTEVRKIIIPSDQPLTVYQTISENREMLEQWAKSNWNILEIHGAVTNADQDWSGLIMPGGFTAEGVADQDDDVVTVWGQPALADIIANTDSLWDSVSYPGLNGDRLYDPDTFALDKLTFWASQNIWDSIGDWSEKHPWFMPERSVQAVRLTYNHYGNCGENQDIVTGGSRAVLIPAANSNNGPEDHVWSEFFLDGKWHTYQIGWSDGNADIDHPGISSGKKWGGGKNNSFVMQTRGDGVAINRTDYYHYTGDLKIYVEDQNGTPIQGATVLVATETYYKDNGEYPLTLGFWDNTDADGHVTIQCGSNIHDDLEQACHDPDVENRCNNYYIRVITSAGNFPAGDNGVALAVSDVEAVQGFEKEITVTIEGELADRVPTAVLESTATNRDYGLRIAFPMLREMACGLSPYAGKYCDEVQPGSLDFYILDSANFEAFAAGEEFEAIAAYEAIAEDFDELVEAPLDQIWYLVFMHQLQLDHEQLFDLHLELLSGQAPTVADGPSDSDILSSPDSSTPSGDGWIPPSDDSISPASGDTGTTSNKQSGSCSTTNTSPLTTALLLALLLLLVCLPRRSYP
jgi:hypothetical protein